MSQREKNDVEADEIGQKIRLRKRIHHSGVSMPRALFARLDRIVKLLELRSRGELLILSVTIVLDMCETRAKRYLPEVVLQYDKNRPAKEDAPKISAASRSQRCGTHFSRTLEEGIATIIKPIGWSRNQFVMEAVKTIVQWCEDPSARTVPLAALLYETALAPAVPLKLKRKS
jgi:hypothetical protein